MQLNNCDELYFQTSRSVLCLQLSLTNIGKIPRIAFTYHTLGSSAIAINFKWNIKLLSGHHICSKIDHVWHRHFRQMDCCHGLAISETNSSQYYASYTTVWKDINSTPTCQSVFVCPRIGDKVLKNLCTYITSNIEEKMIKHSKTHSAYHCFMN